MKTFRALAVPNDPAQLPGFLRDLQKAIEEAAARTGEYLHVAPARSQPGDLVLADGTDWDPGAGAGLYRRNELNTAWVHLG
jgi:hypothetical protein